MGWPVVSVASGGLPVTDATASGFGTPVEIASNGFGTPVTFGAGGIPVVGGVVPFVPLAGSAVDMNFATSQYYPAPLASLMDGTLTNAIGALLTALQSPACSVLLQLKAAPTIPISWVIAAGGTQSFLIRGATDTTATTKDNLAAPTTLTATAGSGAFSTTASKVCVMYDGSTGRSLVMNNGTVATDANFTSTTLTSVSFLNVAAAFNRLTVYTSRLTDVAGKALTV
jgi:hypothetical protein